MGAAESADTGPANTAEQAWREHLAAWAIPADLLASVTESPWSAPVAVFARRADDQVTKAGGVSWERAREALAPAGTVLDVGSGAGAASLPLAPWTTALTAVDPSPAMNAELRTRARALGLTATTIEGRWPGVAAPAADVVVCHHVIYNAPDLDAFALALHGHARRRVVLELTARHPMTPLNPLWRRLHGLDRPDRPTADDAVSVLREAGLTPQVRRWPRPPRPPYASFDELVATTRRRLCLPPERDGELAATLRDLGVDPADPRDLPPPDDTLVTLWWDV